MAVNVQDFIIRPPEIRESAGLIRLQDQLNQNRAFEMQKARQDEQDEWRKIALIRDLTDLSQYQTPDSAANKIGNDRTNAVIQKYMAGMKKMSPSELLAGISKDMKDVYSGMQAFKNDFEQAHLIAAELKKQNPELDAGKLEIKLREDIAKRRLKGDTSFVPEIEVKPSEINLNDDEYLSQFVSSDKALRTLIQNPQGLDPQRVPVGNFEQNMEYEAKVAPWRVPVSEDELRKGGGFLPKGTIPKLGFKEQPISTDILKSADGKQLMGVTDEVYNSFTSDRSLNRQVINNARLRYKDYDSMSPEQKAAAKSATIREMVGELDQTQYRQVGTPQRARQDRTTNIFNMGDPNSLINKVYERINSKVDSDLGRGFTATRFNALANDEQEVVKKAVESAGFKGEEGESAIGEGGANVFLRKDNAGNIKIYRVAEDGKLTVKPEYEITTLSYQGTNVPKQVNVKGKQAAVQVGESGKAITPPPKSGSYHIKGKDYSEKELLDMGYTLDQIKKYKK